jgi:K+ transporter
MAVVATAAERTMPSRVARRTTPAAALAALGIVYGDLGTSPLYTLQTVIQTIGGKFTPEAAIGVLSLILWALVITISVKYCLFVMRADNHGEGGILDLDTAVYFGAHDEVVRGEPGGRLLRWRLPLFAFLFRNSVRAVDLFNLPPPNFVEIGRQIEI